MVLWLRHRRLLWSILVTLATLLLTLLLVECGFLSNADEAQLLRQPEQQKRLAAAIVAGYLNFGNH